MSLAFLNFMAALIIIIVAAKLGGYLSTLIGQPSVLGELLIGLLLGPTFLDVFHTWPVFSADHQLTESITLLAELGVVLLMMLAGLELHLPELLRAGKVASLAGSLGVFVPLLLGVGTALLFGAALSEAVFVGLALSATSVSISAQTLMELRVLRTKVGLALLGAAVFDDIFVILLLSVASILVAGTGGGVLSIIWTAARMVLYLVAAAGVGIYVLPRLTPVINRLPISQGALAFVLTATLLYAWTAEAVGGMAAITGAFLIGLFLARLPIKNQIEDGVTALAYGFLVPVFFVNIGLSVDMTAIDGSGWGYAALLTLVAVASKIVGCSVGAQMSGFGRMDALRLGIGMVSRGEVGLIVAAFALDRRVISADAFAIIVFMVIIATLVTPPMLRYVYSPRFRSPRPAGP